MTVELRHLRSFLAIAEEGNITRAAQRLHVSQPALSRTLAQLERSLAIRLVDRSTHHLILTEAGTTFAISARDAVQRVDEVIASISADVPPIRFGHNWSSATHAAAIMRSWKAEFPERACRPSHIETHYRSVDTVDVVDRSTPSWRLYVAIVQRLMFNAVPAAMCD